MTAPKRRGFGSTIIERSIPHELGGGAEARYLLRGFEADLRIPARYVVASPEDETHARAAEGRGRTGARPLDGKTALVVEDSLMIALDCEGTLRELGATTVHLAASNATALTLIEAHPPAFAVLDVNLGAETSLPIADRLTELGVPFVFATGYGEASVLPERFAGAQVIGKPYTAAMLRAAIAG